MMARYGHTRTRTSPDAATPQRGKAAPPPAREKTPESERDDAYRALARREEALARLIARHGQPDPFHWDVLDDRVGGDAFSELALHIISQQLSTTAAVAIYARVQTLLDGNVAPRAMIAAPTQALRAAGLSGAKAHSLQDLAGRILDGRLSLESLATADDATVQTALQAVFGIGPWSAQMFLLHHYRRPDIMPTADVGLLRSAQSAFALPERPSPQWLETRSRPWRPVRSYAAAVLWAHDRETGPTRAGAPSPPNRRSMRTDRHRRDRAVARLGVNADQPIS
jgi:DNA-3-methyladenine glycosylase II